MSRFREEVKVIPAIAWVIAVMVYAGLVAVLISSLLSTPGNTSVWTVSFDWPLHTKRLTMPSNVGLWTDLGKAAFAIVTPAFPSILVLLIGYVNGDARRRGMRYVLWTLIALLIPDLVGVIIYFLVREPLLYPCPNCGKTASARFNFCPSCKFNLRPSCPQCKREVRFGDHFCPNCACELTRKETAVSG